MRTFTGKDVPLYYNRELNVLDSDTPKEPETYIAENGIKTVTPIVTKQIIPNLTIENVLPVLSPEEIKAFNEQYDFSKLEGMMDLTPKINMPIEQGGAIISQDGTTVLMDGTRILSTSGERSNVVTANDGSAILPGGEVIELNSLPEGSIVDPNSAIVILNAEVAGTVAEVKEVVQELKKENEIVKAESSPTKKLSYIDKLVNYIYSQIYKK